MHEMDCMECSDDAMKNIQVQNFESPSSQEAREGTGPTLKYGGGDRPDRL